MFDYLNAENEHSYTAWVLVLSTLSLYSFVAYLMLVG